LWTLLNHTDGPPAQTEKTKKKLQPNHLLFEKEGGGQFDRTKRKCLLDLVRQDRAREKV